MPELNDKQLDHLLAGLTAPSPDIELPQQIMNALPEQISVSWKDRLIGIIGTQSLGAPLGGALACLAVGLSLGYGPVSALSTPSTETDLLISEMFSAESWDTSFEELSQ